MSHRVDWNEDESIEDEESSDGESPDLYDSEEEEIYDLSYLSEEQLQELLEYLLPSRLIFRNRKKYSTPCKFFMMNRCKKGDACQFSHDLKENSPSKSSQSKRRDATTDTSQINDEPPNETTETPKIPVVCKFFAQGECFKGEFCQFLHSDVVKKKESEDHPCSICFESVEQNGKKFGLLSGCNHVFCLECVREWRNQNKEQSRNCPICRASSYYIIPSPVFVTAEEKIVLEKNYKQRLSSISCKYFSKFGTCPFGDNCFYKHEK